MKTRKVTFFVSVEFDESTYLHDIVQAVKQDLDRLVESHLIEDYELVVYCGVKVVPWSPKPKEEE